MIVTLDLCMTFGNGTPGKGLALLLCQGVGLTSSLHTAKQFPLTREPSHESLNLQTPHTLFTFPPYRDIQHSFLLRERSYMAPLLDHPPLLRRL